MAAKFKGRGRSVLVVNGYVFIWLRRCEQKDVPDQLNIGISRSMTKPEEHSLEELYQYQLHCWYANSAPNAWNVVDVPSTTCARYVSQPKNVVELFSYHHISA